MHGRYKWTVLKLTLLLRELERDRNNLKILTGLQWELVRLIRGVEQRISRIRSDIAVAKGLLGGGRLPKEKSRPLKRRIDALHKRIKQEQFLKFIWKCFGDGIAFTYIDKFSLKHVFFSTEDYVAKQDAGAISGKEGFALEWSLVKKSARHGYPAMLCDITNILRHGDICGLIGPDPVPVEVKLSKNTNKRVQRQLHSLEALAKFYAKDEARNFRGIPHVRRAAFAPPEITHIDAINACIRDSQDKAAAVVEPEVGLHYYCIRRKSGVQEVQMPAGSIFCLLNEAKSEAGWMPYFPFTLSIRNPIHLYEFIRGQITLVVWVDIGELKRQFATDGIKVVVRPGDSPYMLWMRKKGSSSASAISQEMFGRLFYEFQSLAWFVAANGRNALEIDDALGREDREYEPGVPPREGWTGILPEWWQRISDELDEVHDAASGDANKPQEEK